MLIDDANSQRIMDAIHTGQWSALCLPSPEETLQSLLDGKPIRANNHRLEYDPHLGVTWMTNAYGVDGLLCEEPNIEILTEFLTNMALGLDYGPVPE